MFPWQRGVFKLCQGDYAVLVLNCCRKFPSMIFEIRLICSQSPNDSSSFWKVILKSIIAFLKLLSVELLNNILKLQSNITMKWSAAIKISMYLRKREQIAVFVYAI